MASLSPFRRGAAAALDEAVIAARAGQATPFRQGRNVSASLLDSPSIPSTSTGLIYKRLSQRTLDAIAQANQSVL